MPALWLDRLPLPNLPAYTAISVTLLLCSVYFAVTTQDRFESDAVSRLTFAEALQRRCLLPPPVNESAHDQRTRLTDYFVLLATYPTQRALLHEFLRHKLRSDFLYWPTVATDWGEYGERAPESTASSSVFFAPTIYYRDPGAWTAALPEPGIQANLVKTLAFMIHEPLCLWTLINMAYCLLVLLGKSIQQSMFGELRVSEQTQLKDKFWNFVFYKFIFVFGVINVQHMDEVVLWCSWFSALGFLHLLTQLCRDRFEYLSLSASTPRRTHGRLLCLLSAILALSLALLVICVYVGLVASLNTFAFMAAECVLLLIRTFHTMIRYAIHLYDVAQTAQWERKGSLVYLAELMFEVTELVIDLLHHVHMLLWGNIILSMASLIICMELRHIFYQLRHRLARHSHYRRVVRYIELECVQATPADIDGDQCAICWDAMETARRLDCKHCFHATCLRRWLEQDPSCPTCRKGLDLSGQTASGQPRAQQHHRPHWQQHRGRFVSFLPSFSVEVNHTQLLRANQQEVPPASQLDSMARQVQQLFPHVSLSAITEDLQQSGSMEATVENILEGSVHDHPAPPMFTSDELADDGGGWSRPDGDGGDGREEKPYRHHVRPEADPEPEPEPQWPEAVAPGGSRFSKSASERHTLLQRRKAAMLERARRRYLATQSDGGDSGGTVSTSSDDSGAPAASEALRPAALVGR
ncbi:E3 ubiquitin-protein ligase AMFR-like [Amphibalanus amphitrite]|uniref:E3 ubiquitin-protein ligase AMFR-like n=1 Tax=Amphibalanus amphitrite TaxID=1232801 RepID=UPI001C929622|nr:E3 ubiquitin-protein ligase AMFR-like [Amphibalanus amphitrite]XP_043227983.1 E3 ubiquitin-protein ligase AMFR-like [Amphibalanus amphitrite]XP_043227984.1 E3 ubiquitin-protein ligase AMFR-like [Amphibalanus amphitrite]XP_043227985.1 E3 ubiquitin-protein ligase AMFR-like [Amphibalanus amphitrite]XP_043227987.1 E3 ubiquitin-protein ligase AMFR-like [Amphibalanus amphitrite]XP_043227988.1 E3 ubiquitin-protein ligase AMFR-like [Amphibalanus amphitrite]XP_043227989.1 E3 ubiquitin-protein ligas